MTGTTDWESDGSVDQKEGLIIGKNKKEMDDKFCRETVAEIYNAQGGSDPGDCELGSFHSDSTKTSPIRSLLLLQLIQFNLGSNPTRSIFNILPLNPFTTIRQLCGGTAIIVDT